MSKENKLRESLNDKQNGVYSRKKDKNSMGSKLKELYPDIFKDIAGIAEKLNDKLNRGIIVTVCPTSMEDSKKTSEDDVPSFMVSDIIDERAFTYGIMTAIKSYASASDIHPLDLLDPIVGFFTETERKGKKYPERQRELYIRSNRQGDKTEIDGIEYITDERDQWVVDIMNKIKDVFTSHNHDYLLVATNRDKIEDGEGCLTSETMVSSNYNADSLPIALASAISVIADRQSNNTDIETLASNVYRTAMSTESIDNTEKGFHHAD